MMDNVEALESKYREYAKDYGAAYTSGDYRTTNRNHAKLAALLPELRATGEQGEAILHRLMRDRSDIIAMWAATHSLPFAEREAIATLDAIARRGGIIGHSAKMVIKEWQAGRLVID
jgi:hypothetical protein